MKARKIIAALAACAVTACLAAGCSGSATANNSSSTAQTQEGASISIKGAWLAPSSLGDEGDANEKSLYVAYSVTAPSDTDLVIDFAADVADSGDEPDFFGPGEATLSGTKLQNDGVYMTDPLFRVKGYMDDSDCLAETVQIKAGETSGFVANYLVDKDAATGDLSLQLSSEIQGVDASNLPSATLSMVDVKEAADVYAVLEALPALTGSVAAEGETPTTAEEAYAQLATYYSKTIGVAQKKTAGEVSYLEGLAFAKLVDLNGDGTPELVDAVSEAADGESYLLEAWGYEDGTMKALYRGNTSFSNNNDTYVSFIDAGKDVTLLRVYMDWSEKGSDDAEYSIYLYKYSKGELDLVAGHNDSATYDTKEYKESDFTFRDETDYYVYGAPYVGCTEFDVDQTADETNSTLKELGVA